MSHIEVAVRGSKKIEGVLRDGFGAEGRGLHEYLGSVENRIPRELVRKARFIASVRNKVVHQEGVVFDIDDFNRSVEDIVFGLNKVLEKERFLGDRQERSQREFVTQRPQETTIQSIFSIIRFIFVLLAILAIVVASFFALNFWLNLKLKNNIRDQHSQQLSAPKLDLANEQKDSLLTPANPNSQQLSAHNLDLANEQKDSLLTPAKPIEASTVSVSSSPTPQIWSPAEGVSNESYGLKDVQLRLNELGYVAGIPDGIQGPLTDAAIMRFESRNNLLVDGKLTESEYSLLISERAVRAEQKNNFNQGPLLAQAHSSDLEYVQARRDVTNELFNIIRDKTLLSSSIADVTKDADGSYSVRVPVTWLMSEEVRSMINRYFKTYNGSPFHSIPINRRLEYNQIVVVKKDAESSSAIKPYSGRLFAELQGIEIYIEVSLGSKKTDLVIAGNAHCFVSCNYTDKKGDSWIVQIDGLPGKPTLSWEQETPVVIKGLTKSEVQNRGSLTASIRQRNVGSFRASGSPPF